MPEHFIDREAAENGLLECAAFLAERIQNNDGHAEALRSVIPLFLRRGEVDLAAELANSIDDPFNRDKLLIQVAEKCAAIDDDEYAMQLVDAVEEDGLRIEGAERIALLKSEKGELEKADEMAADLVHPEYVYADIAVRYAAASDVANSEAFLKRIDFPAAKVSALQAIAELHRNSGEREKGIEFLESARAGAAEIEHDEERLRILSDIGTHFLRIGAAEKAVATFENVRDLAAELESRHREVFLVGSALGLMQAGDVEKADGVLDLVTDKTQIASVLVGFSREYVKKNELDDALETLEEAHSILKSQRDNEVRDSRAKYAVQRMIAVQFAQLGRGERAMETAQGIVDEGEKAVALAAIAAIFADSDAGMSQEAVRTIPADADRLAALVGISDVHKKRGNAAGALEMLDEVASLTTAIERPSAQASALTEVVGRYIDLGETETARRTARLSLEVISTIRSGPHKAVELAKLAEVYQSASFTLSEDEGQILRRIVNQAAAGD